MSREVLRDLFVVVADLDMEHTIKTLLCDRQRALGISLEFDPDHMPQGDLLRFSGRDAGCFRKAVELLQPQQNRYRHAMLIFDHQGCGAENWEREDVEADVEDRLEKSGWKRDRAVAIVIDPELEAWVWSDSPHVADRLGWKNDSVGLKSFLAEKGLWIEGQAKPRDPKAAMREACCQKRIPLVATVFADLAAKVSLRHCSDGAFQKFRDCLQRWFPAGKNGSREE